MTVNDQALASRAAFLERTRSLAISDRVDLYRLTRNGFTLDEALVIVGFEIARREG